MVEYISRDDALAFQDNVEPDFARNIMTGDIYAASKDAEIVKYLNAIPAADVVPVLRCGECKHWKRIRNDCILASCELDALVRSEDFFCADGERTDDDGDV